MRRYCFRKYFGPLIVFRNQIRTWSSFYDNKASCCILFKSISNFLRYGVLKNSFGRGLRSIWAILVNIELDLPFLITKLSAKFHRNRSRTFWVIVFTDRQTDRQTNGLTRVKQYLFPNIVWGEVTSTRKCLSSSLPRPSVFQAQKVWARQVPPDIDIRLKVLTVAVL